MVKLSRDSRISPDKLSVIFDIGAKTESPPILWEFKSKSKIEQQRPVVLLILYSNFVVNNELTMSSYNLKPIIQKSNVDPTNLFNIISGSSDYKKSIVIEGKTYRITEKGKIEAKKLLKEICDSI